MEISGLKIPPAAETAGVITVGEVQCIEYARSFGSHQTSAGEVAGWIPAAHHPFNIKNQSSAMLETPQSVSNGRSLRTESTRFTVMLGEVFMKGKSKSDPSNLSKMPWNAHQIWLPKERAHPEISLQILQKNVLGCSRSSIWRASHPS